MEEVIPVELSIQEENEKKKEFLRSYRKALRREERILDEIQRATNEQDVSFCRERWNATG